MPIAAVPKYLGNHFENASPALRFGMYLPIWTTQQDQAQEVTKRSQAKSKEGQALAAMLKQQGMAACIAQLVAQKRLKGIWDKNDFAARTAWHDVSQLSTEDKRRMGELAARQRALAASTVTVLHLDAVTVAPFTTGLGNEHPLENGFAFLNPYGLPYLPGSGVKGVLRQAAKELASGQWGDNKGWSEDKCYSLAVGKDRIPLSVIDVLFGLESPERSQQHVRGALSFWDVIPQIPADSLMVEIMTPHQSHYYQQKRDRKSGDSDSPHDSGQPNPICFLTVPPGSHFTFYVVCDEQHLKRLTYEKLPNAPDLLDGGATHWKTLLQAAFQHAFQWLGFGAKTAVGYGAMKQADAVAQRGHTSTLSHCAWVDHKLEELCSKPGIKPEDALRGTALAEAVRAIEDPTLRAQAVADIVARWQEKGWWEQPSGSAAKKAKAIYDELLAQQTSSG